MCPMQLSTLHSCSLEGCSRAPSGSLSIPVLCPITMAHVMSCTTPPFVFSCGPDLHWAQSLPPGRAEAGRRARPCTALELGGHESWVSQGSSQLMQRGHFGRERKAEKSRARRVWLVRHETVHFGAFLFSFST